MSNSKSDPSEGGAAPINPTAAIEQQRQRVRETMAAADKLVQQSMAAAQKALQAVMTDKPAEQASAAVQKAVQATETAVKQAERSVDAQIKQAEQSIVNALQLAAKAQGAAQPDSVAASDQGIQRNEQTPAPAQATPAAGEAN
ncbi:hypothetical protein SAMN04488038_105129 [Solimonas aquatica]|uniref:Uncharacterized protein n=1 Tax=Solimonas aquatica TaxID=489703 RepID=A0A1H9ETJ6_9GAMM|nr:hypothetical protein [Solimonas aquatica]SEQ28318.1 hypothetical protein SAMN04488038_105129 [Solimonas aquatica]